MKHVSIAAVALGLMLGGVVATPAPAKDKPAKEAPPKPSEAVVKANAVVKPALDKKDYATAKAAVDPLTPQTDDDKLFIGQWYVNIGQGTSDEATLGKGIDMMLASGKVPADAVRQLAFVQGQLAYKANDFAKAQAAMQQALAAGSTEENVVPILTESMNRQGQRALAIQTLSDAIGKRQAAGQPVPASWFQRGFTMAYDIKPTDPAFAAVRQAGIQLCKQWVAADPRGTAWHDALLLLEQSSPQDVDTKTDILRLKLAANGLRSGPEYLEYAEAVYQKNPGEAKAALDAGVSSGKLTLASNRNASEINQLVTGKIAADKASLPSSDKAARAAANAKIAFSTGDGYLGYGENAKAVDLYTVALQKSGDANVANTRIGIALFRSGDKAGAKAAFAKVTGARKDMADFWTILIDHPASTD